MAASNYLAGLLDANGRPFPNQGWDSQNHQFVVPQFGQGAADPVQTNVNFAPQVFSQSDGQKTTYSAAINGLVPVASATDIFAIGGVAGKTIRIIRLEVSGIATTILDTTVRFAFRSGGTQSAGTVLAAVPHDSGSVGAGATVWTYTANAASLGTLVGYVRSSKLLFNLAAPTAGSESGRLIEDFGDRPSQAIVLRGVTQFLCINLAGVSVAGGSIDLSCEWTEDNYS